MENNMTARPMTEVLEPNVWAARNSLGSLWGAYSSEKEARHESRGLPLVVTRLTETEVQQAANRIIARRKAHAVEPVEDADDAAVIAVALLSTSASLRVMRGALTDAAAHLAGAASAYRRHAARHRSQGRAAADALFSTRADDFDRAARRASAALSGIKPEGR